MDNKTYRYFSQITTEIISLILLTFSLKILMTTNYVSTTWLTKLEVLKKISLFNLLFLFYGGIIILECLIDLMKPEKKIIYLISTIIILVALFYVFFTGVNLDKMMTDVLKEYFDASRGNAFYRGAYAICSIVAFIVLMSNSLNFVINIALKLKYILTLGRK